MMDMEKISCLIVTRNQPDNLINLVKHVYPIVDDIVIVDSSDERNLSELRSGLKRLRKARIFYAAPLGYEEPYRMYGLRLAKHDWILSLDAGQMLNPRLKHDLRKIIHENKGFMGFMIRQDNFLDGKRTYSESYGIRVGRNDWQVRLFRKSKVFFRGMVHESPDLGGEWISPLGKERLVHVLPESYNFIQNHEEGDFEYKIMKCMKLEMFEGRQSYGSVRLPSQLRKPFLLYGKAKGMNKDWELSKRDYFIHERLYTILNNPDRAEIFRPLPYYFRRKVETIFTADERLKTLSFEISNDIKRVGGVIRYLKLDRMKTIETLNRKSKVTKLKGIDFFVELLVEEFYRRHPKNAKMRPEEVVLLLDDAIKRTAS